MSINYNVKGYLFSALMIYLLSNEVGAKKVTFDIENLRRLGFDSDVAEFFSEESKFLPGENSIKVTVNNNSKKNVIVTFDSNGFPCFDKSTLQLLGLDVKKDFIGCKELQKIIENARITLKPESNTLDIIVPEDYIAEKNEKIPRGIAGIINYSLNGQDIRSGKNNYRYFHGNSEYGLNLYGWILRQKVNSTYMNDKWYIKRNSAYAQKNVEPLNSTFRVGELNTSSFSSINIPLTGIELHSEENKLNTDNLITPLKGVANTTAIVEVVQRDNVIYTTLVSPGPFSLNMVEGLTPNTPIELIVRENDGSVKKYQLYNNIKMKNSKNFGYNLAIGRYKNNSAQSNQNHNPFIVNGSLSGGLYESIAFNTSALYSSNLSKINFDTNYSFDKTYISNGIEMMRTYKNFYGYTFKSQIQYKSPWDISLGGGWIYYSKNSFDENEVLSNKEISKIINHQRQVYNSTIAWSDMKLGSYSYSLTHQVYSNSIKAQTHTLSSLHRFGNYSLSFNLQKSKSSGKSFYLSLSFPLGEAKVKHRSLVNNNTVTNGINYTKNLDKETRYSLDVSDTKTSKRFSGTINTTTPYSQASLSVSKQNNSFSSFSGAAQGSMAVTNNTYSVSSQHIGDTFATLEIENQSGIKITGGGANTKTDRKGIAIIPSIQPYQKVISNIDSRTIPLNMRLESTTVALEMPRGAVEHRIIRVEEFKQLLLEVKYNNGEKVPVGYSYYDGQGNFMGTIVGEGNIMLVNEDIGKELYINISNKGRCKVSYISPEKFDPNALYEEMPAVCN